MNVEGSHPLDAGFDEYKGISGNFGADDNTFCHNRDTVPERVECEILASAYTNNVIVFKVKHLIILQD